ncbi:hypothetical protein [Flavobacterium agrisoli]|uniref:Uncharacterized protein n=1 Tax=Flavobacterium agrisoli TaxID=2793066 RepID=A0A934PPR6_9FLAO|nr:hypothetical protein [Flavobacterium agrisoli]MBK0370805.1 hypothetical protein [Flavobacterium agrisoli]
MDSKHHEDLIHIRSMMERSSRFISLSGLSGVCAGLSALIGGLYILQWFKTNKINYFDLEDRVYGRDVITHLIGVGMIILIVALISAIFFTVRKSQKYKLPIWTTATKQMLIQLAIPLLVGAIFCLALIKYNLMVLVAPTTLLFYGLALVNAEKYTYSDIKYLGVLEIIVGLVSLFYLRYGLVFWIIGFGILHIVYGLVVFKKYK